MADKWSVVSAPHLTRTYKGASGSAKTKGTPEVRSNILVFPFDDYLSTEEPVYVFDCPMVRATASGANADIASVNFVAGQKLFWDASNSKVTNVSNSGGKSHRAIGYALESKDLSGGVAAGDSLMFELRPGEMRQVSGQHTTVAASDTVVTGLALVFSVVAQLDDDPVDGAMHATSSIGDQAGAPDAGSILIKTWKSTDADATLIAATTFGKKVNWIAVGI